MTLKQEIESLIERYEKEINNLKENPMFNRSDKSIQTVSVLSEIVQDLKKALNGKR